MYRTSKRQNALKYPDDMRGNATGTVVNKSAGLSHEQGLFSRRLSSAGLESMRNMNNLLQIRYFGLIPRFYSLNNALSASQNHAISLKISDFRDDSHTPHRLLISPIIYQLLFQCCRQCLWHSIPAKLPLPVIFANTRNVHPRIRA